MKLLIAHILTPPVVAGDEDQSRIAALLHRMLLGIFALIAFYVIVAPIMAPSLTTRALAALSVLPLVLAVGWLNVNGQVRRASRLLVGGLWLLLMAITIYVGGVRAPAYVGGFLVVVLASVLLGRRAALYWAAATIVAGLLLAYLEGNSLLAFQPVTTMPLAVWATSSFILALAAVSLYLGMTGIEDALRRARYQLAERQKTEASLQESNLRYRRLADAAHEAIVISQEGRIIDVNDRALQMFGCGASDIVGRPIVDFVAAESRVNVGERIRASDEGSYEVWSQRLDGSVFPTEVNARTFSFGGRPTRLSAIHDVSERWRAEQELRQRAERLEAFNHVAQHITTTLELDTVLSNVAQSVQQSLNLYYCAIALKQGEEIVLRAACIEGSLSTLVGWHVSVGAPSLSAYVAAHGETLLTPDVLNDPRYLYMHDAPNVRSELVVPLKHQGAIIGVLDTARTATDAYPCEDVGLLESIAAEVAVVIANARLYEQVQQQLMRTTALLRVASHLNAELELKSLLALVCREAAAALDVSAATLSLYDEAQDAVTYAMDYGLPPGYGAQIKPYPRPALGELTRGGVFATENAQAHPELPNHALYLAYDAKGMAAVQMQQGDTLVGSLAVITFGKPHVFQPEDLALLRGLADQAMQAIVNAQLFYQVRVSRERLEALNRRVIETQELERRELSRELHDQVGQNLSALSLSIAIVRKQLPPEQAERFASRLDDMQGLIDLTVERTRDVMAGLRPTMLDEYGLASALRTFGDQFAARTGINTVMRVDDVEPPLPVAVETALFRIVQEALNNTAKHAEAAAVTIALEHDDIIVRLSISDDGQGFDPTQVRPRLEGGMGMIGMRERAEAVGARLMIDSAPGHGSRVTVEVTR